MPSLEISYCLTVLAMYEAKTAKNSNFWMFWWMILLISHLFKVTRHLWLKNSKNLHLLDILTCNSADIPSFQNLTKPFGPTLHRCKKCSDISETTSGGRAEIENLKNDRTSDLQFHLRQQMLLLNCQHSFYICGALDK